MKLRKNTRLLNALLSLAFLMAYPAATMAQSITVFDVPDALLTQAFSINDNGEIAGSFYDLNLRKGRGFIRDRNGGLVFLDAPTATQETMAMALNNNGELAGYLSFMMSGPPFRGFFRDSGGTFQLFDAPDADYQTIPQAVNQHGDAVGSFTFQSRSRGFLRDRSGTIVVIDAPKASSTTAAGINDQGIVVGGFSDAVRGKSPAYIRGVNGEFTVFEIQNYLAAVASGINNRGDVAGVVFDATLGKTDGFIRDNGGNITVFQIPNALAVGNVTINDRGVVAGSVRDERGIHGFLRNERGTITLFDPPNSASVSFISLNTSGDVAGTFAAATDGIQHAFIRLADNTPPTTAASSSPEPNDNGWNGTNVTVTITASDNSGGSGVKDIRFKLEGAQQMSFQSVAGSAASVLIYAEGTTVLTYFATDQAGNAEPTQTIAIQLDKTSPVISGMPATPCSIWPPNHRLVQVATVTAIDTLSGLGSFNMTGLSNDPAHGQIVITRGSGQFKIQLSADKDQSYKLTATATDLGGNTTTATRTCVVPHDQGT